MYFKIALKNVKKSYKDFLIYFLTLAFSVCLFYTFNSFQAQQEVLSLSDSQNEIISSISLIMGLLSNFVSVVLAFLILYANNFLIKRRKREFGLYMLLGMPKQSISRVLIYETFIIGFISLIIGIGFGLLASQLLTVVTASLFTAKLNYHFVFSMDATLITLLAFTVIFVVVMIFNAFVISRYKLIDLMLAGRKNEKPRIHNLWLSVLVFIASLCFLYYAYTEALGKGMMWINSITPIIVCGCIGTVLFFLSLSGFLLKFIQSSKKMYYRKLNMFVLRQVNSKINSNFLSMSVVCIMLLLCIGALSTGFTIRDTLNSSLEMSTPFDHTVASTGDNMIDAVQAKYADNEAMIDQNIVHIYADKNLNGKTLAPYSKSLAELSNSDMMSSTYVEIIPLSEYNNTRVLAGKEKLSLQDSEMYMFTSTDVLSTYIEEILKNDVTLPVFQNNLTIKNKKLVLEQLGTANNGSSTISSTMAVVVPDSVIPKDAMQLGTMWNYNTTKGADTKMLSDEIWDYLRSPAEKLGVTTVDGYSISVQSRTSVIEDAAGSSVMFTYIGIYLGVVFLVASAVILALQQLSEADDSRHRYQILTKIGAEKKMMNQSVLMQIGIYFFMPLALALVHAFVGIKVVNSAILFFGKVDIVKSSLLTALIIILCYGAYYLVTYYSYNRILHQEKA